MITLLTNRESDVLLLRAAGLALLEIAKRLRITRRLANEYLLRGIRRLQTKIPGSKRRRANAPDLSDPCSQCQQEPRMPDRRIGRLCLNARRIDEYYARKQGVEPAPRSPRNQHCNCGDESCTGLTCDVVRL